MAADEKVQRLLDALAEYFDIESDKVRGFVIGVERFVSEEEGLAFAFSLNATSPWHIKALVDELEFQRKQLRAKQSFESVFTEEPTAE